MVVLAFYRLSQRDIGGVDGWGGRGRVVSSTNRPAQVTITPSGRVCISSGTVVTDSVTEMEESQSLSTVERVLRNWCTDSCREGEIT